MNKLSVRDKKDRCGRVKSEDGIEPLRLFNLRLKEVRYVRLEKEKGIGPLNEQYERSKILRKVLQLKSGS
jgi:hypothetical protein